MLWLEVTEWLEGCWASLGCTEGSGWLGARKGTSECQGNTATERGSTFVHTAGRRRAGGAWPPGPQTAAFSLHPAGHPFPILGPLGSPWLSCRITAPREVSRFGEGSVALTPHFSPLSLCLATTTHQGASQRTDWLLSQTRPCLTDTLFSRGPKSSVCLGMAPGPTCHLLSCHESQPLTGVSHSHFLEAYASPPPHACCQGCRVSGHGAHPPLPWAPHLSPLDKHRESSTSPHSLQGEPGAPQRASPLPPFLPPSLPLPHSLSSIQRPASCPKTGVAMGNSSEKADNGAAGNCECPRRHPGQVFP